MIIIHLMQAIKIFQAKLRSRRPQSKRPKRLGENGLCQFTGTADVPAYFAAENAVASSRLAASCVIRSVNALRPDGQGVGWLLTAGMSVWGRGWWFLKKKSSVTSNYTSTM
jgi:hypothetical protein